jgi:hypothetical protein
VGGRLSLRVPLVGEQRAAGRVSGGTARGEVLFELAEGLEEVGQEAGAVQQDNSLTIGIAVEEAGLCVALDINPAGHEDPPSHFADLVADGSAGHIL